MNMKCNKCGFENNDKAKFCTKCGNPLNNKPTDNSSASNNNMVLIVGLLIVIVVLVGAIGYFALNSNTSNSGVANENHQSSQDEASESPQETTQTTSQETKSWQSIGSYSGSGSGSKTVNVPSGKIMIKVSAYPIKNYATNHVYVSGSNGKSAGVDWGPESPVATRTDSVTYTSSSSETFTIDYYETVSWEVEFYRYQ